MASSRTFDLKIPDFHGSLAVLRIAYGSHHSRQEERLRDLPAARFPSQPSKRSLARPAEAKVDFSRVFAHYPGSWRLTSAATTLPSALPLVCGVTCAMTLPIPFMPRSAAPVEAIESATIAAISSRVNCCGK